MTEEEGHYSSLPNFGAAPAGHGGQQPLEAGLTVAAVVLRQQDTRVGLLHQQNFTYKQ